MLFTFLFFEVAVKLFISNVFIKRGLFKNSNCSSNFPCVCFSSSLWRSACRLENRGRQGSTRRLDRKWLQWTYIFFQQMRQRLECICQQRWSRSALRDDERIRASDGEVPRLLGRRVCGFVLERPKNWQQFNSRQRTPDLQVLVKRDHRCLNLYRKQGNVSLTLESRSFEFKNGDVLMFKDEGSNGVIHIESITYQCIGAKCTQICICMDIQFGLNQIHLPHRAYRKFVTHYEFCMCKQMLVWIITALHVRRYGLILLVILLYVCMVMKAIIVTVTLLITTII